MCLPADGVYAGWYERPDGDVHPCAINLGRRPTFYEHADHSLLEAHLLDFAGDLYGERAEVRFAHFLRSERKFDGIDAIQRPARPTTSSTPATSSSRATTGRRRFAPDAARAVRCRAARRAARA